MYSFHMLSFMIFHTKKPKNVDLCFFFSSLGLLELYCDLFTSSSNTINRVLVSRVIHTVVQGCCMQTDGFNDTLFSFFPKAILNVR